MSEKLEENLEVMCSFRIVICNCGIWSLVQSIVGQFSTSLQFLIIQYYLNMFISIHFQGKRQEIYIPFEIERK